MPAYASPVEVTATELSELLTDLLSELAQQLSPADLAALATGAKQDAAKAVLDNLLTELGQKLEVSDIAGLATGAKQDLLLAELGQKLEPSDIAALATGAKQDAAKAVLDTVSSTLTSVLAEVDQVEELLASLISANHTDLLAVIAKNETIRALLAGTLLVENTPASATAFSDTGTVGSITKLRGLSIANTSTSARAQIRLRNNTVAGTILDTITLGPGESVSYTYPAGRTVASGTLYMQLVSGAVEGSVYTS